MATPRLHGPSPDLSVVVVSRDTRAMLQACLDAIEAGRGALAVETVVVDNASADGSAEMVASRFPCAVLVRATTNLGLAAAVNLAASRCRSPYLVLLNPDARVLPGGLQTAVARMEATPRTAIGGGRLIGDDGSWQPSARMFPSPLNDWLAISGLAARFPRSRFFGRADRTWADPDCEASVDWVPGAFAIVRRSVFDDLGGFDERFFLYYEEVDLCRRVRAAGYEVRYWPDIAVVHTGGASARTLEGGTFSASGSQILAWRLRSALLYYRKHHGRLGAWLAACVEGGWHAARAWRHAWADTEEGSTRARESSAIVSMVRRAWADTCAGSCSPSRPWAAS